jgi:hypothetical protein
VGKKDKGGKKEKKKEGKKGKNQEPQVTGNKDDKKKK